MLRAIGFVVVVGALAGAWGVHEGWFTIDRTDVPGASRVTFGLDKEKLRRDAGTSRTEFDKSLRSFKLKIDELRTRTSHFAAEERSAADHQIEQFETTHDEIARKIDRLAVATESEFHELEREIKASLDEAMAAVDRALESHQES
jgi:hypothetical protein